MGEYIIHSEIEELPGDPERLSLDKDAQIVLDERETVVEDVPGGMLGAVMVETCITVPRAQNVEAERDYVGLLYGRFSWVLLLSFLCMAVQLYMIIRVFTELVLVRRAGRFWGVDVYVSIRWSYIRCV